jgi:hypothetical protein
MGSSGNFFINLLPFKGGPDGPWDPEKKGDDDSQSNRAQDGINERGLKIPDDEFDRHDRGIRILYREHRYRNDDPQNDPVEELHKFSPCNRISNVKVPMSNQFQISKRRPPMSFLPRIRVRGKLQRESKSSWH